jgi:hypothetical protein
MKVLAVFLVGAPASDPPLARFPAVDSDAARREATAYIEKLCRGKAVDLREIDVPAPATGAGPN